MRKPKVQILLGVALLLTGVLSLVTGRSVLAAVSGVALLLAGLIFVVDGVRRARW